MYSPLIGLFKKQVTDDLFIIFTLQEAIQQ